MKIISFAIVAILLAANASAEECTAKTGIYEGKSYSFEMCVARVDDVIKTSVDGFVQIHYIVQYKGQRFIVDDPLARSNHVVGEQICVFVAKLESPADADSQGFGTLNASVYEPNATDNGCQPS